MDWRNAFRAVTSYRLPRTRALQEELAVLHAEHSAVSGELREVRAELEQTRTDDARQIETLHNRLEHLARDRDSAREQTRLLEGALEDSRQRQTSTEQRMTALEAQLEDARHLHESNLYLTGDRLSRMQSEQTELMTQQSVMARSFYETSRELLDTLRAQVQPRLSAWQAAVLAGLLFLCGALVSVLVMDSSRGAPVDLNGVSHGIRELKQLMETHFRTHDELLETLSRAIGNREGDAGRSREPAESSPDGLSGKGAETGTDLRHGTLNRPPDDGVEANRRQVRLDLHVLGLLGGTVDAADEAAEQRALQRFGTLYQGKPGDGSALRALLHSMAEQARADARRYELDSTVVAAIRLGSIRTGVDFPYLMELASVESGFDPAARAPTSTATGMYQFKEETWLEAIRDYGDRYGLGEYASQVELAQDAGGLLQPRIADSQLQQRVLDLRLNPRLSALLAAECIKSSRRRLSSSLAREPARTDLYLTHFFGISGAISFLKALAEDPQQIAGEIFPGPAQRNRSIFRKRDDKPRTVAEVYHLLARKFNTSRYEES